MEKKVLDFMYDHQLVEKNRTVIVGVSGGPDSMALLHFLHSLKKEWNLHIIATIVDHQLRAGESEADVQYVQEVCEKWDIPFVAIAVDVNRYKNIHKLSTQVAARKLRYKAFEEKMKEFHADYLALGHHGDDQVETLIMSLARTTNLSSLTGIPLKRDFANGEIIRPFLCLTKKEIKKYCHTYAIRPRIDSTNLDTYYTRNDIRKFVVPKLKERNNNLHRTMQALSETLQEDEAYLRREAKKVFSSTVHMDPKERRASLSILDINKYPVSLQRRVYRLTLDYLYHTLPDKLTYMHEHIFLSLLNEKTNNKVIHFPQKLFIERSYHHVFFYFEQDIKRDRFFHHEIHEVPTCIALPNGAVITITYINEPTLNDTDAYKYVCSREHLSFPLHIRTRNPGDRMRYEGLNGSKKIKDIFIDEKIPRHKRDSIYILTDDQEQILWLIGRRKGILKEQTERGPYLLFEYIDDKNNLSEEEEDA